MKARAYVSGIGQVDTECLLELVIYFNGGLSKSCKPTKSEALGA
jgi:hypothetical protein